MCVRYNAQWDHICALTEYWTKDPSIPNRMLFNWTRGGSLLIIIALVQYIRWNSSYDSGCQTFRSNRRYICSIVPWFSLNNRCYKWRCPRKINRKCAIKSSDINHFNYYFFWGQNDADSTVYLRTGRYCIKFSIIMTLIAFHNYCFSYSSARSQSTKCNYGQKTAPSFNEKLYMDDKTK